MDKNNVSNHLINEYCKTLSRKELKDIPNHQYIKKPYLESYIISLSTIVNEDLLVEQIIKKFVNGDIQIEEVFLFVKTWIELSTNEKRALQNILLKEINESENIVVGTLLYVVYYFQLYMLSVEFLYDNSLDNEDLFKYIEQLMRKQTSKIKSLEKKNIHLFMFHIQLEKVLKSYISLFKLLVKEKLIEKDMSEEDIRNSFLRHTFANWYEVLKKRNKEGTINKKSSKWYSRLLCIPHIN